MGRNCRLCRQQGGALATRRNARGALRFRQSLALGIDGRRLHRRAHFARAEAPPRSDLPPTEVALSPLVAGQGSTQFREQQQHHYQDNAYHVSEGKRLYEWFNCTGCHAHGGGAIGPALMDDRWIYGGEIDQIYLTIAQGRPNGMPAFGGKIPPQQIWQIAAYVRTMGGHGPKSARPTTS